MPVPRSATAIARPSLNQEVLARLRAWIVERVLQPGEPIRDQELAERLFISERTANRHLSNIFTKLGVRNRTAAARVAIEAGLAG